MKNLNLLFFIFLMGVITLNSEVSEPLDDLLKSMEEDASKNNPILTPPKTEPDLTENSNIEQQVLSITDELKKINTEFKKIVGPDAEKQIAESQKKRETRQKEAERKLKERKSSGEGYHSSSYGGKGGYGGYDSSGYGSPYSTHRPRSHSGGGYGGSYGGDFGGGSPWDSDFGRDMPDKNKKFDDKNKGSGLKSDRDKSENELKDKDKKDKSESKGSSKEERSTLQKANSYTESIKDTLKQILQNAPDVQISEDKKLQARNIFYSNILTNDSLTDLTGFLKSRKDVTRSLSKKDAGKPPRTIGMGLMKPSSSKITAIKMDREEKSLWNRFLPHLMQMLVFEPEEDTTGVSEKDVSACKKLISTLEQDKFISHEYIKQEQEKLEAQITNDLKKELAAWKNNKTKNIDPKKINTLIHKKKRLFMPTQNPALIDLLMQAEVLIQPVPKPEDNE